MGIVLFTFRLLTSGYSGTFNADPDTSERYLDWSINVLECLHLLWILYLKVLDYFSLSGKWFRVFRHMFHCVELFMFEIPKEKWLILQGILLLAI